MSYRWNRATSTLTLTYTGDVGAVVTLVTQPSYVEVRATVTNSVATPLASVRFPADLVGRLYRHVFGAVPCADPEYRDFTAAADLVLQHVAPA